ncbi:DUF1642 domain-containing protein [Enterococcus faecalis]|nr:DUF1642 domain-containing protein [Enterococcus faecalis]NSV20957.1 DUF1642 domain-containing protein [Enterococcus faecalis]NSV31076.1 DUF1642 domain-containing protein [Enterococcus faecalis]NSV40691.1 DUF1642 domain-containing protein [Enterococcus faecalis]NSV49463.1 DUF1642 domain-containing protein [Enterococcus faecalis]
MNKQELIDILENLECSTESLSYDNGYEQGVYDSLSHVILLDEPKKVVIPQVVADWIKYAKRQGYGFMQSYDPIYMSYPINDGIDKWIDDNEETFAHAWLDGYEVEKEPLYAVKGLTDYFRYDNKVILFNDKQEALEIANKIGECCGIEEFNYINDLNFILISDLRNDEQTDEKEPLYYVKLPEIGYMRFGFCIPITENIEEAKKYTEQEIKAIDERYWPFAVKVE